MFIINKYTTTYYKIIIEASKREQIDGNYYEKHHIIPKSLGGPNSPDNIVSLTPREHYLCHALLPKMVIGAMAYKMYAAFNMMHVDHNGKRYTSRLYEYYKIKFYKLHSERQKGKKRSTESRKKQSETTKGIPWSDNARNVKRKKPTARAVLAYKKGTNDFVGEWESISLCGKELKCDATAIWNICEGKPCKKGGKAGKLYPLRSCNGYSFKYRD